MRLRVSFLREEKSLNRLCLYLSHLLKYTVYAAIVVISLVLGHYSFKLVEPLGQPARFPILERVQAPVAELAFPADLANPPQLLRAWK